MAVDTADRILDTQVLLLNFDSATANTLVPFFQQHQIAYHQVDSIEEATSSLKGRSPRACILAFSFYDSLVLDAVTTAAQMVSDFPCFAVTNVFSFEHAVRFFRATGVDVIQLPDNEELLLPLKKGRPPLTLPLTRRYTLTADKLAKERMPLYLTSILTRERLLSDKARFELHLAFQEALTNSLEHGNLRLISAWKEEIDDEGRDKFSRERKAHLQKEEYKNSTISVETSFDGHIIYIKIIDSGQGFSFGSAESESGSQIPVSCFGRGCSIILNTMDDMQYSMGGRCIEMKKIIEGENFQWP